MEEGERETETQERMRGRKIDYSTGEEEEKKKIEEKPKYDVDKEEEEGGGGRGAQEGGEEETLRLSRVASSGHVGLELDSLSQRFNIMSRTYDLQNGLEHFLYMCL